MASIKQTGTRCCFHVSRVRLHVVPQTENARFTPLSFHTLESLIPVQPVLNCPGGCLLGRELLQECHFHSQCVFLSALTDRGIIQFNIISAAGLEKFQYLSDENDNKRLSGFSFLNRWIL